MKVVVTGGSGLLGTRVLQALSDSRRIKRILSLDLQPPATAGGKISWKTVDIAAPGLERYFEGADAVVHLAFIGIGGAEARQRMQRVNVGGSRNVFEAAIACRVPTVVYTSSVAAYGLAPNHPNPVVEDSPRQRTSWHAYAENKYDVEAYLDELEKRVPELRIVRLRPGIVFGSRVENALGQLLRRGWMIDASPALMPVVWDEDVAAAVRCALERDVRGAFNLVARDAITAAELTRLAGLRRVKVPSALRRAAVSTIVGLGRIGLPSRIDPAWIRAAEFDLVASGEHAVETLGWQPRCPTARDLAVTLGEETVRSLDSRIQVFVRIVNALAARLPEEELSADMKRFQATVQMELTGRGGGDLTIRLDEGRPRIDQGVARPPDTTLTLRASTFLELLGGTLDLSTAYLTGRIQMRGEPAGQFLLAGLITTWRNATRRVGMQGWIARRLEQWFLQGVAQ